MDLMLEADKDLMFEVGRDLMVGLVYLLKMDRMKCFELTAVLSLMFDMNFELIVVVVQTYSLKIGQKDLALIVQSLQLKIDKCQLVELVEVDKRLQAVEVVWVFVLEVEVDKDLQVVQVQ